MKLIFLHGMPGVGKLTVARQLEKLTGFKLFHNQPTVDLEDRQKACHLISSVNTRAAGT